MKKIKLFLTLVLCLSLACVLTFKVNANETSGVTYYASPTGLKTNSGLSAEEPLEILTALYKLKIDDTLILASGTYDMVEEPEYIDPNDLQAKKFGNVELNQSGRFGHYITVKGIGDVILDFSDQPFDSSNRGITIKGSYWHFDNVKITKAGDNGLYIGGAYNVIENCEFFENRDSGLQLGRSNGDLTDVNDWPSNNLIKNCTSYANYDDETYGENADGFAAKLTVGYGNVFDGCIAYRNSDDGWDLYAKTDSGNIGTVFLYNCVSFENGFLPDGKITRDGDGIGFKLGGSTMVGDAVVVNCMAFNNRLHGFSDNSNPGVLSFVNCTAFNNSLGMIELPGNTDDHYSGQINPDFVADGMSSNFDTARTELSYNTYFGNLSYTNNGTGVDAFSGVMAYSILKIGANKYGKFTDYKETSSHTSDLVATYDSLSDNTFKALSLPSEFNGRNAHTLFRNSDMSVNMGDMLALKSDNELNAFIDGKPLGCVLNKSSYTDYKHMDLSGGAVESESLNLDLIRVKGASAVIYAMCDTNAVYQDLVLPVLVNSCEVSWESSNPEVLEIGTDVTTSISNFKSVRGIVLRDRTKDVDVTITATIKFGEESVQKTFDLHIMKDTPSVGEITGYENKYLVNLYEEFTLPSVIVTNASSRSGRLLEEGVDKDYVVEPSYEYATDKNSKFYPVSKIYTNKAGVYKVTYKVVSNIDKSDYKTVTFMVYVSSPKAAIDFVNNEYKISLTPWGFKVFGQLSGVSGNVYAYSSSNPTESLETVLLNGTKLSITDDFINQEVEADNSHGYYIHLVVSNLAETSQSQVYSKEITVNEISSNVKFIQMLKGTSEETEIYLLTKDLDFDGFTYPISVHSNAFKGLFNGNGHTISNVSIKDDTDNKSKNINLWYKLDYGTIMNVNFKNVSFESKSAKAKNVGIVGTMNGGYFYDVKVENISVMAYDNAGVIGHIGGGENYVSRVHVKNDDSIIMDALHKYVGGVVGNIQRDTSETSLSAIVSNCLVEANVGTKDSLSQFVGGIVGRGKNDKEGDYLLVEKNMFRGTILSSANYIGGIIGGNDGGIGGVIIRYNVSDCEILYKSTLFKYITPPTDEFELENFIQTVGHKNASPITGRYTIPTGNGYIIYQNNFAPFADNNSLVGSDNNAFFGKIETKVFYQDLAKFDLENIWIFDEETKTISLR